MNQKAAVQKITYIISQYPAISHTFIMAEINGLKEKNMTISVASINRPDRGFNELTNAEKMAYKDTTFVKSALKKNLIIYLIRAICNTPKGFVKSFGQVLCAIAKYPYLIFHQIAYWLESMVVADVARCNGSTHLHAHFATSGCTVAMLASTITGIEFSLTVHGPDEFYNVDKQRLESKFAAAKFIICISDFAKSQVMKYTPISQWSKLHVCYLGVDSSLFYPVKKDNRRPVLLCVGRLVDSKGQGVLIDAANILSERKIDFEVCFVGDGPYFFSLQQQVNDYRLQDRIKFLGKVNHDGVQVLQREADIFVLPSFAEGIPVSLMEAMSSGTPCVATYITGIPELISNMKDGMLVRPGNAVQLADALAKLICDPDLADKIANEALRTINKRWHLKQSNARLYRLFQQLLSGRLN